MWMCSMSCSPFNEFISSPHFNEPFEFITPDRMGDLVQEFCPTFNPFEVEQSNLDMSVIEVIHPNPQTVEPLDADALLERLDRAEHEQEEDGEVVEVDPIEVLEGSSLDDSVVELFHDEDDGQLLSQSEVSDLDLQKKQKNTPSLESMRRPFFKVVHKNVTLNGPANYIPRIY